MKFVNYRQLHGDIVAWMHEIPAEVGLIVGIPRSGMLVASILGLYRNLPVMSFDEYCGSLVRPVERRAEGYGYQASAGKLVLLIDDSVYSGNSIKDCRHQMLKLMAQLENGQQLVTAAAYVAPDTKKVVQTYARIIDTPRCFEWNVFHKPMIKRACLDIDGVLTIDPTSTQNMDPTQYKRYLRNAKPKFIPSVKIGALVTSRVEADRPATRRWLSKHNIAYEKLYMSSHKTAQARRKVKDHAIQKARAFVHSGCTLFIESSRWQAAAISRMAKTHVICTDDMTLYKHGYLI